MGVNKTVDNVELYSIKETSRGLFEAVFDVNFKQTNSSMPSNKAAYENKTFDAVKFLYDYYGFHMF